MKDIKKACEVLKNHGVISFATETVMGLAVLYDDFEAYTKLNKIKNRQPDKPYSLMLSKCEDIKKYAFVSKDAEKCINRFLPGSLTLLLKVKPNVPSWVTCNTDVIGIRVPSNKDALDILTKINKPLLVPSANKAGEKPAMNSDEVRNIFKDEVDYIYDGEAPGGVPTTIADFTHKDVRIIREGPISLEEIKEVLK